jgi:hypothetical protein
MKSFDICIANTSSEGVGKSICGKHIGSEFAFENIDHAYYHLLNKGRLQVCIDCNDQLVKIFEDDR